MGHNADMAMVPTISAASPWAARLPRRWLLRAAVGLVLLLVGAEALRVFAGTNRHTVVPGRVYRCSQPAGKHVLELVDQRGIRTVINLRGLAQDPTGADARWYLAEATATHDRNVSQEDITFSANRLPPPGELRRLIEVLDKTEYPILLHCKQGADRTGLASAVVRLLQTDSTLDEARRELWPTRGHFWFGRTRAMDDFFDRYAAWLAAEGTEHSPDRFRTWATKIYTPGAAASELTWLDLPTAPVPAGKPFAVRLRAINRSTEAWELKPGNLAAIHLSFTVASEADGLVYRGQAGLFRATVPPGGEIVFTCAIPGIEKPGQYVLLAEMTDARGAGVPLRCASFVQYGDRAAMGDVIVK